ncbi:hypothetical protein MRB53_041674 [Persea americana]|nr:hypothetical protein MRB53_041674 [Persea americana]
MEEGYDRAKADFADICEMAGNMSVGNPRDRIFSLIHLGQADHNKYGFEVVYERSIGEIYEDAVLVMIKQSNTLDVIMDSRPDRSVYGECGQQNLMSSFIPDFTRLVKRSITKGRPAYDSGVHELKFKVSLEPSSLKLATFSSTASTNASI